MIRKWKSWIMLSAMACHVKSMICHGKESNAFKSMILDAPWQKTWVSIIDHDLMKFFSKAICTISMNFFEYLSVPSESAASTNWVEILTKKLFFSQRTKKTVFQCIQKHSICITYLPSYSSCVSMLKWFKFIE